MGKNRCFLPMPLLWEDFLFFFFFLSFISKTYTVFTKIKRSQYFCLKMCQQKKKIFVFLCIWLIEVRYITNEWLEAILGRNQISSCVKLVSVRKLKVLKYFSSHVIDLWRNIYCVYGVYILSKAMAISWVFFSPNYSALDIIHLIALSFVEQCQTTIMFGIGGSPCILFYFLYSITRRRELKK